MAATQAVLAVLCIQLALAAAGWWLSASLLGLSRAPARYWSGFCLLALVSAVASTHAVDAHDSIPISLANLALATAFIAVGRGVGSFIDQRPALWPDVMLLSIVAVIGLVDVVDGLDPRLRSVMISGCLAGVLARDAVLTVRRVYAEFGAPVTALVMGPMLLTASVFVWRSLRALLWPPSQDQLMLTSPGATNLIVLMMLMTLAAIFNVALAMMVMRRLVKRLHHLSRHDSLTGLLNRRAMIATLEAEQSRVRRGGEGWALMLVDIDHFKRVNDLFGHTMGDTVLCRVADSLRQSARDVDTVARMGGEEFCVLAPMTDLHGAALLAERLRQAVAASAEGPDEVSVTISVGVALADRAPNESAASALSRVDVALYRAKAAGRDRVEMPPDAETGLVPVVPEPAPI